MSLLSRWFRRVPPPGPTLEEEVAALAGSDALRQAALGHADEGLRVAAIGKLSDGDSLQHLAGLGGDTAPAAVRRAAQQRLARLVDDGAVQLDALCAAARDKVALLGVAGLCEKPEYLPQAFASIEDPALRLDLVLHGASSRIRQLAAQAIEDPEQLKPLLKATRGSDKGVYRILKEKQEALVAGQRRRVQLQSEAETVCAALERHSHSPHDPLFVATLEHLQSRWKEALAHAKLPLRRRADLAVARCRDTITRHVRAMAAHAAEQAAEKAAAAAAEQAQAREQCARQQEQEEAAAARAAVEQARQAEEQAHREALRAVNSAIGQLRRALHAGNTRRAHGLRRALDEKLHAVPQAPPYLTRQIEELDEQLARLQDWKNFAVAPKRLELVEEMEALIGAELHPRALAERVRELQQQWKSIHKGGAGENEAEWQRFHQAAQTAYQPCKTYFEEQAQLRRHNEQECRALIEQLTAFESGQDWKRADWRAVSEQLRRARQSWPRHARVSREATGPLQESFNAITRKLQARLDGELAGNLKEKKALLAQAERLIARQDPEAATELHRLQQQWKRCGPVPEGEERSLWAAFQRCCLSVQGRHQEERAHYTEWLQSQNPDAAAAPTLGDAIDLNSAGSRR